MKTVLKSGGKKNRLKGKKCCFGQNGSRRFSLIWRKREMYIQFWRKQVVPLNKKRISFLGTENGMTYFINRETRTGISSYFTKLAWI